MPLVQVKKYYELKLFLKPPKVADESLFPIEKISEIQEIYRMLFLRGMNNAKALTKIEAEMPATQERDEIISFIKTSDRGVMKGYISR